RPDHALGWGRKPMILRGARPADRFEAVARLRDHRGKPRPSNAVALAHAGSVGAIGRMLWQLGIAPRPTGFMGAPTGRRAAPECEKMSRPPCLHAGLQGMPGTHGER